MIFMKSWSTFIKVAQSSDPTIWIVAGNCIAIIRAASDEECVSFINNTGITKYCNGNSKQLEMDHTYAMEVLRLKLCVELPSEFRTSVVVRLPIPPMSITAPSGLTQEAWPILSNLRSWLTDHCPLERVTHVVLVLMVLPYPPQSRGPFYIGICLSDADNKLFWPEWHNICSLGDLEVCIVCCS